MIVSELDFFVQPQRRIRLRERGVDVVVKTVRDVGHLCLLGLLLRKSSQNGYWDEAAAKSTEVRFCGIRATHSCLKNGNNEISISTGTMAFLYVEDTHRETT
jgi:hypothetical protein